MWRVTELFETEPSIGLMKDVYKKDRFRGLWAIAVARSSGKHEGL